MNPFRNILRLSIGDFVAKSLNFIAFIYLARVLGVASYGVLEFAISILAYLLLFADGGLELWSIREVASGKDARSLVSRVVPVRLILTLVAFSALLGMLFFLPNYPGLQVVLLLFGLTLFIQAVNLKWVFMGQEQMTRVAIGLIIAQLVFASAIFLVVQSPSALIWIPVMRLASDLAMTLYFGWLFIKVHGGVRLGFTLRNSGETLRPAFTLGASNGLALMNYNFDTIFLGLIVGPAAVGLYSAAYKPVTVVLALPTTYFLGLFPALSRTYSRNKDNFREMATKSFRLSAICGMPIGVAGMFLAAPIIALLFGSEYARAVPVLQILIWSAVLVILRGTFRQSLNSAGKSRLDLRCASFSVLLNITLNILLIPRYGIIGAAIATVASEVLWFSMAYYFFNRYIVRLKLISQMLSPFLGATVMGIFLFFTQPVPWLLRLVFGVFLYFGTLWLLRQTEIRSLLRPIKPPLPPARAGSTLDSDVTAA